jgi:hypothetical protein
MKLGKRALELVERQRPVVVSPFDSAQVKRGRETRGPGARHHVGECRDRPRRGRDLERLSPVAGRGALVGVEALAVSLSEPPERAVDDPPRRGLDVGDAAKGQPPALESGGAFGARLWAAPAHLGDAEV